MHKQLLSAVAIGITLFAYLPYIRSIRQGATKPHVFSWIIWGSATLIVSVAQLSDRGGAGAWPIAVSGILTIYTAVLAWLKKGDLHITRMDWVFFIFAMTALPFWYLTSNPMWAVLILTTVDVMGFGPTFRKSYHRPYDESLPFFILMTTRNFVATAALEHYSLTTVLFPAATAVTGVLFIFMVVWRRRGMRAGISG